MSDDLEKMTPGECREFGERIGEELRAEQHYTGKPYEPKIRSISHIRSGPPRRLFIVCEACVYGEKWAAHTCSAQTPVPLEVSVSDKIQFQDKIG